MAMLPFEMGAMAYRGVGMMEVRDMVGRRLRARAFRAIGRATGLDRKTIAVYVRAALAVGVQARRRPPSDEQITAIAATPCPANTTAPGPELETSGRPAPDQDPSPLRA